MFRLAKQHLFIISLFLALLVSTSSAHKTADESFSCPIDGNQWKQEVDVSGTELGRRLDLKPLGPTPAPWTVPQCPKCRFVLYEREPGKIPTDKLKPYILSEPYQSAAKDQPTYFCLALIELFLGETPETIAYSYLRASWQTELNPTECRKHLGLALTQYLKALGGL